jgi:hypothetical protein
MKKCLLKAMLVAMFMVVVAFAWGQSIFYEEPFDTNNGWTLESNWSITAGALTLSDTPTITNYDLSATSPNIVVPATAGDMVISHYLHQYTPPETFEIIVVAGGTPNILWSYNESASWGVVGGQDLTLSLVPFAGQTIQLKFRSHGATTFGFYDWFIYDIKAYASLNMDMGALSLTGSTTPTQGTATNYIVTVKNTGLTAVTAYTVKLMKNTTVEIGSQAGTSLAPNTTQTHTFNWTPDATGPAVLTGKVILTGDLNPNNDITPELNINVQPTGVQAVTIGAGDQTARIPMNFFYKSSLYEALYMSDELGFTSGTITSLALYNDFADSPANGATKIWLGTTNLTDLSAGFIPSTQMTLVFDGTVNYPTGINTITIPLTTPYMHTPGNLVMMVKRPLDGAYYSSSDNFLCQTIGTNRARVLYSDSIDYDPAAPAPGTLSGQFPKTTFFYTDQALVNDLGCLSVSGNITPSAGSSWDYTVTVKNNGTAVQDNYQVKLFKEGNVEVGSVNGTTINSMQTLQFTIPWTPATVGQTFIYGKVVLATDEIAQNNQTANFPVDVQAAGVVAITVGSGGSTVKMPVDFYWKNSLFETVFLATELNIGGLLTGVQFYNNFSSANVLDKPVNIWMGETTETDLSAGWIPSTQLTQVFNGTLNFPAGANSINIPFATPLPYGGGNLVMMVQRPMDTEYYSSSDLFVSQTVGTNRTRNLTSDSVSFDPTAPAAATPTGQFPKTTFFFITEGMGALNGTVSSGGTPLEGATITVANSTLTYTTGATGTYSFPYIAEGVQTVSATKHGYTVATHNVTIVEDQTATQDFAISLLPQVAVSGRVVGSDAPTVGLAGATVNFTGYEPYTATTDAAGLFNLPSVFASQTYDYTIVAEGYAPLTGQAVVGTTALAMGDLIVSEIAYPASQVVATEATDFSNVVVTWNEPVAGTEGWLHYDSGENSDSIGTGGAADFDVAVRYPGSALQDYAGTSLQAVKVWPAQAGSFSLRVWTGGTPTTPGTMVVDQAFTPVLDQWNTITLNTPVPITGTEELWFGYRCNVTGGYPAGCDAGPAIDGFGNMMYFQDAWGTLTGLNPDLNYNWNIQGYAGFGAPTRGEELIPIVASTRGITEGTLSASGIKSVNSKPVVQNETRAITGYKVWRLTEGQETNEATWTALTPTAITALTYTDNAWTPLPSGVYKYAVKAAYSNNVYAAPAFSNAIHKGMMGTLSGTVTEFGTNLPVQGATITAGDYSGTSNTTGAYSFAVYAGNYTVTASKAGYQNASQPGVVITGLQTTTQDFVLTEITLPPAGVVAELAGNNVNITWMEPGSGAEMTEGFEGATFPPADWTQVITDTGAAGTTGVLPTWCRFGSVALDPAVPPHSGAYQAGLWWSNNHQDEWLKTPAFNCLPNASLTFWSYVFFGSTNDDHYRVKVSTNNGSSWTTLWDATTQTGGWNKYVTPIVIDLAAYSGQEIMLAWQAEDTPTNDGLWYVWFMDDIHVGNPTKTIRFNSDMLTKYNPNQAPEVHSVSLPASRAAVNNPGLQEESLSIDRAVTGYKVWRLLQGQEANEAQWTTLTQNPISATAYQDAAWTTLPDGMYKWAVKTVYTGGVLSNSAFSNPVERLTQIGTVAGFVRDIQNQPINGATIVTGTYTATSNANGAYSMAVPAGTHSMIASHPNYVAATQTGVIVVTGETTTVNFQLQPSSILLEEGFETYEDFALSFAPWTVIDVDQSETYGLTNTAWLNAYAPQAYIIFNPSATVPPVTTAVPHGGNKFAASFAATTPPNNDWLITPQIAGGGEMKFWARTFHADYGLEEFKIGVSTTGTAPANFTIITGASAVLAPLEWTEFTYDLSAYADQQVYVAIQCISNDHFIFMVDDVTITGGVSNQDGVNPVYTTALKGNYPNPFNPETTISFSVKDAGPVNIEIFNVKGQLVKKLVNDVRAAGEHTVVWNGMDNNGRSVSSGIYYFKMNTGKYSSTKKMIMMK